MQRDLSSLPIPSSQLSRLHEAGFTTAQDILAVKPSQLSQGEPFLDAAHLEIKFEK